MAGPSSGRGWFFRAHLAAPALPSTRHPAPKQLAKNISQRPPARSLPIVNINPRSRPNPSPLPSFSSARNSPALPSILVPFRPASREPKRPSTLHSFVQHCTEHFIRSCKWYCACLQCAPHHGFTPRCTQAKQRLIGVKKKYSQRHNKPHSHPVNSLLRGPLDVELPSQQSFATYETKRPVPLFPASTCLEAPPRDVVDHSINSRSCSHQTQQHYLLRISTEHSTMSPKLKPLLLPLLVEERRKRESMSETEMDLSSSTYTQNSSASDVPSPVTPTFSARGHLRYSSSASSIESSYHTSVGDSPSSPTFIGSKTGKRSLPDVQEEPQERDEDFDMFDDANDLYECLCKYYPAWGVNPNCGTYG
jgi:hypothetical protein